MFRKLVTLLLTSSVLFSLSSCSQLITLSSSDPIDEQSQRRTFGRYVNDELIESKAVASINKTNHALSKSNIDVVSFNGIVLLVGQTSSQELRNLAEATTKKLQDVRRVHNAIEVGPNARFGARLSDRWITSRIKSKLVFNNDVDSSRVKIIIERGVVYLMGIISKPEADRATQVVRKTRGVQKVVRIFEYI